MPANSDRPSQASGPSLIAGWGETLATAGRAAGPALLFGLRLWAAVCLALYVAFWLELDNPYWAGTTAAIVCQPSVGASLRKGWFRMIGTVVGAVVIVVLTACFPQDRLGYLVSLALWGAACALVATLLRNFAAYAAALAGYTAAIIASDDLGAVGGAGGDVFMLAVFRTSEIGLGIVCAGIVLAGTDFGGARRRLAARLAEISAEISDRFAATFSLVGPQLSEMRPVRRDLVRRVIALDPVIDEALGEVSDLRYHSPILQATVGGLFTAMSSWRVAAIHLEVMPSDQGRHDGELIQRALPQALQSAPVGGDAPSWTVVPSRMRRICAAAIRAYVALPARTPSLCLLADEAAKVFAGLSLALDGLALLVDDPARFESRRRGFRLRVPDWLPALVNAARAFATIAAVSLFWVITAWPNGAFAIAFAAIGVILFSPRADQAYAITVSFMVGTVLTTAFAAIVKFALLPGVETYLVFCLAIGIVLVPAGALMDQPRQTALFTAMAANFVPLLAPTNPMTFDTQQFYNSALAIVAGVGAAAVSFRLLPPLPPALRARRLLALTLRDLRRLTMGPIPRTTHDWESLTFARLSVLPEQAELGDAGRLLAALSVGSAIIRLRRAGPQLGLNPELDSALAAFAQGHSAAASTELGRLDGRLASVADAGAETSLAMRARGRILLVREVLSEHGVYFDTGETG
jgi:uncharacterized membrane protein YccC